MPRTPEQVLRELVAEQIFQIAQLVSQVDTLTEQVKNYKSEDLVTFLKRKQSDKQTV